MADARKYLEIAEEKALLLQGNRTSAAMRDTLAAEIQALVALAREIRKSQPVTQAPAPFTMPLVPSPGYVIPDPGFYVGDLPAVKGPQAGTAGTNEPVERLAMHTRTGERHPNHIPPKGWTWGRVQKRSSFGEDWYEHYIVPISIPEN